MGVKQAAVEALTLLFTVPATDVYELRDVVVWNGNTVGAIVALVVQSGSVTYRLLSLPALAGNTSHHEEMRQILPAGSLLNAYSSQTGATFSCTGYHFAGA